MYRTRIFQDPVLRHPVTVPLRPDFRRQLLWRTSRSVHSKPGEPLKANPSPRRSGYVVPAVVLSIISAGVIWTLSTPGPPKLGTLNDRIFQPFGIVSKKEVSSTSSIFTLRPAAEPQADPYSALWPKGIWSVEFKQPQLQIARSYTPLPPTEGSLPGDLRFLIRKEHKGEVSNYLYRLALGATIHVRGPRMEYEFPDDVTEVVFLAGGTGIAPAFQAIHALLERPTDSVEAGRLPRIRVLWANRRREDCIGSTTIVSLTWWQSLWGSPTPVVVSDKPNDIVKELQDLEENHEGKLKIDYFVDEEGIFIGKTEILRAINSISEPKLGAKSAPCGTKLLILSGPDGFVNYFAGPKDSDGGNQVHGRLGGVLATLRLDKWTVVAL